MDKKIDRLLSNALSSNNEKKIKDVFELIYNQYYKLVAFSIAKFTSDIELIKDLTNEVFLKFYENVLKVQSSVKYYLLVSSKNIVINYLKRTNNCTDFKDVFYQENNSHVLYIELIEDLRKVLSDIEVEIIIKHSVEGYTFKELESIFNIKAKTINKTYERAIKKFKNNERSKKYEK